jgi:hypothetical protein
MIERNSTKPKRQTTQGAELKKVNAHQSKAKQSKAHCETERTATQSKAQQSKRQRNTNQAKTPRSVQTTPTGMPAFLTHIYEPTMQARQGTAQRNTAKQGKE